MLKRLSVHFIDRYIKNDSVFYMSEVLQSGEISTIVFKTKVLISPDELARLRDSIKLQTELVEATRQLIEAGRKVLKIFESPDIGDIYDLGPELETWTSNVPEGSVVDVRGISEIITGGG